MIELLDNNERPEDVLNIVRYAIYNYPIHEVVNELCIEVLMRLHPPSKTDRLLSDLTL